MALYSWFNRNQSTFSSISEQPETKTTVNEQTSGKQQTAWVMTQENNTLNKVTPNTQLIN
tara:strand:+ start:1273 stop:1452 length:180 start_codon:yes stop_codon:yes gene_type:complete